MCLWRYALGETVKLFENQSAAAFAFHRQFAGIAALVERVFSSEFTSKRGMAMAITDGGRGGRRKMSAAALMSGEARAEIEVADFDRLFSKLDKLEMRSAEMRALLERVKEEGERAEVEMATTTADGGGGARGRGGG